MGLEVEKKYTLANYQSPIIKALLTQFCQLHPEFPYDTISTIYYDTPDWDLLSEKENSEYHKLKVRVRWYQSQAFIELKHRIGGLREKFRFPLMISPSLLNESPLNAGHLIELTQQLREQGFSVPTPLLPTLMVRYHRHRFIEPFTGNGINLDTDICVPKVNSQCIRLTHGTFLNTAVCEWKGQSEIESPLLSFVIKLGCRKQSFSKYEACFQKLKEINQ